MESSLETRIHSIGADVLTPIVQNATSSTGQLGSWTCEPIHITQGGIGASAIYRFSGAIQLDAAYLPWSLILKVLSPSLEKIAGHPYDPIANLREYEFYQSDLWKRFPTGFRAARCYWQAIVQGETGQEEVWLWLEDLTSLAIDHWTLEHEAQAAHAIGMFNGFFLVNRPLPQAAWLNNHQLRQYIDQVAVLFPRFVEQRDQPLVRRMYPPTMMDSLIEMWQQREEHLSILDRLPQTVCHGDAGPQNLYLTINATGKAESVAIDWGGVGVASIGQDLAQFLMMSLFMREESYIRVLDTVIFDSYLDGLRAVGWQGDERWIRLGYTTAMIKNRVTYISRVFSALSEGPEQEHIRNMFARRGLTLEEGIDKLALSHTVLADLFAESLELRKHLL